MGDLEMVLPSSYEEFTDEIQDPSGHEKEIREANCILNNFIADMDANVVPSASLEKLISASQLLGEYAGYPEDTFYMIDFLYDSGGNSYRDTADVLKRYMKDMNVLIEERLAKSKKLLKEAMAKQKSHFQVEDDLPF